MKTRTDCHCPSQIVPEDYEFVAFEHVKIDGVGGCHWAIANRKRITDHMAKTGGTYSRHEHGGNCMVCGSVNVVYTILFYHAKTNSYVRTGQDCAEKLSMSYGDFNAFKKDVKNYLTFQAGKKKAQGVLESLGIGMAWALYEAPWSNNFQWEERTIRDIVEKLVRYGSISERQSSFLVSLFNGLPERDRLATEKATKEAAEKSAAKDAPSGRITVKGTVLGLKTTEGAWGISTKVLIQTTDGWKCYGSRFNNVEKGDEVEFKATFNPSNDDPKFAFFSRPISC